MTSNTEWDVVVIGAGIHGAGVAQAATAAGYSVLVLEQYNEPAKSTSSRSSKLIHGGLRYLETGQIKLVRECLRERRYLLKNAPHLVRLLPFRIPVYRATTRRPWKIALGLTLYSLFSYRPFKTIPKRQWQQLDGLTTEGLEYVFSYQDAQTDDAKLTRAVLESAQMMGAEVLMQASFDRATIEQGGCRIVYHTNSGIHEISASVLVNTAGAWANRLLEKMEPPPKMLAVDMVQGSHIILPGNLTHPYYLEAPQDKRAVFVLPWKNQILVGTTELEFLGDPADVQPHDSEILYLLEVYNHYFNNHVQPEDVVRAFAGLRILPDGRGLPFTRSRDIIFTENDVNNPRVFTLYGGKLTSYRATAEKLMGKLQRVLARRRRVADTRNLKLPEVD